MIVVNCNNAMAPNPSCCSNPRVLCPACAGKALNAAWFNSPELIKLGREMLTTANRLHMPYQIRRPIPLGLPTYDFESPSKAVTNDTDQ
jgi:hypothetical protein